MWFISYTNSKGVIHSCVVEIHPFVVIDNYNRSVIKDYKATHDIPEYYLVFFKELTLQEINTYSLTRT